MASSYSTDLKIELMVTGENAGTWGEKTNDNLNVIQQAIAGYGEQSIAGGPQTTTLTIANSPTLSVARNIVIKLTGTITGNQIVTVPSGIEKTWIVSNGTTGAFTVEFKTSGGTGTTWSATDKAIKILYSDGTNINAVDITTLSGTVASAQIANLAVTSAKLASFAVTEARLASFAVTTSRLATNAVTAIKITQSTITQSKLAANSVGSNQLISTGVTAASYTAASITVDADGRITAASSGSAGAGGFVPTVLSIGPSSGTFTATPTASRLAVYMVAGGGGGGGAAVPNASRGGVGGTGGFGFYNKSITQPFSQPFSVGGAGGGGGGRNVGGQTGIAGNAGGSVSFTNVGTVNGGNGGAGGPTGGAGAAGNAGTGPGASLATSRSFVVGVTNDGPLFGTGGTGGLGSPDGSNPSGGGNSGSSGVLAIFENTGT
jgi:hypothetical protein